MIPATCENGVVTAGGVTVEDATILGAGVKSSAGIVLLDGEESPVYIALNSTDLDQTLGDVIDSLTNITSALTTIATSLTAIGAGMTGATTAPPPTLGANVTTITSKVTALGLIKTDLQNLKGALT